MAKCQAPNCDPEYYKHTGKGLKPHGSRSYHAAIRKYFAAGLKTGCVRVEMTA